MASKARVTPTRASQPAGGLAAAATQVTGAAAALADPAADTGRDRARSRARLSFGDAFGDAEPARRYAQAAREIRAGMDQHLWRPELGRFARMVNVADDGPPRLALMGVVNVK